jgi:hypothetical protein
MVLKEIWLKGVYQIRQVQYEDGEKAPANIATEISVHKMQGIS